MPRNSGSDWLRIALCIPIVMPAAFELVLVLPSSVRARLPAGFAAWVASYEWLRTWAMTHPIHTIAIAAVLATLVALCTRWLLKLWHNVIAARLSGAALDVEEQSFPKRSFDLHRALAKTPAGQYFIGVNRRGKPVYLSDRDLDTHGHIMGHTGSGKTKSVLEPLMYQDMRAGKGLMFVDAKGSSENVAMIKALAAITHRRKDLKVFALAQPEWSNTYNPVHIAGGETPVTVAERIFSCFTMENEYYRAQAKTFFYALVALLAGTGKRFNLTDVRICVGDDDALDYVSELSDAVSSKEEIRTQFARLGRKRTETFTGLYSALWDYNHPLLNAYNPDIVIENIMNERGLVYFNLPANRYQLLAPAIGKIVLQHVQSVGTLRQEARHKYDQTPFAVNVDEFSRFAYEGLVSSLAMLRDAHVQFRLAHQSLGDLEQVSDVFARQVKDNTRWKIFLFENDPDHLEKVSQSYGTYTSHKKTVRMRRGAFFTSLNTGDVSKREVEAFVLHPNALKNLEDSGQGYLMLPKKAEGLSFEMLPRFEVPDYPLQRSQANDDGLNLTSKFLTGSQSRARVAERRKVS